MKWGDEYEGHGESYFDYNHYDNGYKNDYLAHDYSANHQSEYPPAGHKDASSQTAESFQQAPYRTPAYANKEPNAVVSKPSPPSSDHAAPKTASPKPPSQIYEPVYEEPRYPVHSPTPYKAPAYEVPYEEPKYTPAPTYKPTVAPYKPPVYESHEENRYPTHRPTPYKRPAPYKPPSYEAAYEEPKYPVHKPTAYKQPEYEAESIYDDFTPYGEAEYGNRKPVQHKAAVPKPINTPVYEAPYKHAEHPQVPIYKPKPQKASEYYEPAAYKPEPYREDYEKNVYKPSPYDEPEYQKEPEYHSAPVYKPTAYKSKPYDPSLDFVPEGFFPDFSPFGYDKSEKY